MNTIKDKNTDIIKLKDITKYYNISKSPIKRMTGAIRGADGIKNGENFPALENINFTAKKGECVGIIGRNGSGKSTLLKIIAGITAADDGSVSVQGSVSAMLELGVGFNPEYSGRENIMLDGVLTGTPRSTSDADEIFDFAEIPTEFRDMPAKTYSSGMLMRLGFAVSVFRDSDIMLVDEVLAVGDVRFRAKCLDYFKTLIRRGKTVLFVSHDVDTVRRFCTRAVLLESGSALDDGDVMRVTSRYMEICTAADKGLSAKQFGCQINKYGSRPGSIKSVHITPSAKVGDDVRITVVIDVARDTELDTAGVSVSLKDKFGLDLCVFRTETRLSVGLCEIEFEFENPLIGGEYILSAAFENRGTHPISYYEYTEGVCVFKSMPRPGIEQFGLVSVPCVTSIRSCDDRHNP